MCPMKPHGRKIAIGNDVKNRYNKKCHLLGELKIKSNNGEK